MLSKLIKSNFKNDFSHMITFFLIMVLSVFMLHTGIMILIGYNTVYKEKLEKYNFADLIVLSALKPEEKEKTEEIISTSDFIESYEKVVPIQKQFKIEKAGAVDGDSKNSYDTTTAGAYVLPYGSWGEIDAPHFCELSDEEYDNPIYISLYYNANFFKAKLGDSIDVQVDDKYYTSKIVGFNIKVERMRQQLTQEKLAEASNISIDSLSKIETGKQVPSCLVLYDIAKALGVEIEEFYKGI